MILIQVGLVYVLSHFCELCALLFMLLSVAIYGSMLETNATECEVNEDDVANRLTTRCLSQYLGCVTSFETH